MKFIFPYLIFLLLTSEFLFSQNVGIGTATPHTSARLDVTSTNSGFLPPRMTLEQRDAIASPTPGLMVFNTTSQTFDIFTSYGWLIVKPSFPSFNKLLGGTGSDICNSIYQTSDRGYIIAGSSSSATGDVSGPYRGGGSDAWVVKINGLGNIVWNKLLGGNNSDGASIIQETSDGGYIMAGSSASSANGDVTGVNHGSDDIWIVKLDNLGNIVWNKLLGGTHSDNFSRMQQTSDGGYIIAGVVAFGGVNGDITGTHHGLFDWWILKLDGSGNIVWNKLLGGDMSEFAPDLRQTSDGGYIVAGYTTTSANGDVTGVNHGGRDSWVVKLDALGNIVWNKLLGGNNDEETRSISQTSDGGYILAGYSFSSANGDVTGTNHGVNDCWIVRLDALGSILWNKLLGGSQNDIAQRILQTSDGGFVFAAPSFSGDGDVTGNNHGNFDYWIVKLNNVGSIIWNKLIGGSGQDSPNAVLQNNDGNYMIAGFTYSSANGDVTGTNHGGQDIWIVTLTSAGNLNQ